jgi:hypothetical protein
MGAFFSLKLATTLMTTRIFFLSIGLSGLLACTGVTTDGRTDPTSTIDNCELCDGLDNDGDGAIDENLPDSDKDGICDGLDDEDCDGLDNDGDGLIDEDQGDSDEDGLCDGLDAEECDDRDNNGNGLIDEDLPDSDGDGVCDALDFEECDCIDNNGDAVVDEGCEWSLSMMMTADDAYTVYVDGVEIGDNTGWSTTETWLHALTTAGVHHIAVEAEDVGGIVAGFLASVSLNGVVISQTGDGSWLGSAVDPGAGWETSTAGLSAEVSAMACDLDRWKGRPADLIATGAEWVWQDNCDETAWFDKNWWVLEFEICDEPPAVEACDGKDNDGDGRVDEDFPDTDADGTADCVDVEECGDCVDNDGDGTVDEKCAYELGVYAAVDSWATVYLDGSELDTTYSWKDPWVWTDSISGGTHHLAFMAKGGKEGVAGFIASVFINGDVAYVTGEGSFMATSTTPAAGWETSTVGMVPDTVATKCLSAWSSGSTDITDTGAQWVWDALCWDTETYPENWYVLEFQACPGAPSGKE